MYKSHCNFRLAGVLAAIVLFAANAFGDMATPSPTRPANAPVVSPGYDWGFFIGTALWVVAGIIVVVWIGLKLSKRSSK